MCLAVPGKLIELDGNVGKVDYGGVESEVNMSLVEADVGEYVIVHAGFAIEVLDEKEAQETLALFREMLEAD